MQRPGRRELAHAALGGIALAGVCLWFTASPGSVVSNDALDYAQMGRELARGHGASTLQIFPRHVPFLHENGLLDGPWPNLHRYPLPTWLDAVAALFTDDPRRAAFYQSAGSYLAQVTVFAVFSRWLAPLGTDRVDRVLHKRMLGVLQPGLPAPAWPAEPGRVLTQPGGLCCVMNHLRDLLDDVLCVLEGEVRDPPLKDRLARHRGGPIPRL